MDNVFVIATEERYGTSLRLLGNMVSRLREMIVEGLGCLVPWWISADYGKYFLHQTRAIESTKVIPSPDVGKVEMAHCCGKKNFHLN